MAATGDTPAWSPIGLLQSPQQGYVNQAFFLLAQNEMGKIKPMIGPNFEFELMVANMDASFLRCDWLAPMSAARGFSFITKDAMLDKRTF